MSVPATVDTQAEDTCGQCGRPLGLRAYCVSNPVLEPFLDAWYCTPACATTATREFLASHQSWPVVRQLMDLRLYRRSDPLEPWQPKGRVCR